MSRFFLTEGHYDDDADHAKACSEQVTDSIVADWSLHLMADVGSGGTAALCDSLDIHESFNTQHFFVNQEGAIHSDSEGSRRYFFERHDGNVPHNWGIVHDQMGSITLGSAYGITGAVLCWASDSSSITNNNEESSQDSDDKSTPNVPLILTEIFGALFVCGILYYLFVVRGVSKTGGGMDSDSVTPMTEAMIEMEVDIEEAYNVATDTDDTHTSTLAHSHTIEDDDGVGVVESGNDTDHHMSTTRTSSTPPSSSQHDTQYNSVDAFVEAQPISLQLPLPHGLVLTPPGRSSSGSSSLNSSSFTLCAVVSVSPCPSSSS